MALLLALEIMLVAGGPRGISGMIYLFIYVVSGQRFSIFEPPRNVSGGWALHAAMHGWHDTTVVPPVQ